MFFLAAHIYKITKKLSVSFDIKEVSGDPGGK